jgi:protein disulfide-isomerase
MLRHMNRFKCAFTAALLLVFAAFIGCNRNDSPRTSAAPDPIWMIDYEAALQLAEETDRPVMLNFTGSDWCPPCIQLKKEVFTKDEFKEFARENVVLVELDFPRKKALPQELVAQNERLLDLYGVQGFPTVILLDHQGNVRARTGYSRQSPSEFVQWIQEKIQG